jgi:hypothetical protein
MTDLSEANRRTVLKSAGGLVAGTALLAGVGAADGPAGLLSGQEDDEEEDDEDDENQVHRQSVASMIESHGHYSWFPLGPASWGRSDDPYDMEQDESRWLAEPTDEGGVRILVANLGTEPPNRNAGFDVHLGPLGELETVTIDARTLQTPNTTGPAVLFIGLFLDRDDNGEFLTWETIDGVERPQGTGNDDEGIAFYGANGAVTIDGNTTFTLVSAGKQATLAELQAGELGDENEDGNDGGDEDVNVTGETAAALYVGVVNGGEGVDEVVIDDLRVVRS